MAKKNVKIERLTAEFMLDLPEGTEITGVGFDGTHVLLEIETEFDFPEGSTLVYENDEFGNSALTGAN